MSTSTTMDNLRDAVALGRGIVTRIWDFNVRNWVTSVSVADINNDGEAEVIACSRDGRVLLLSADRGDWKWVRVIDNIKGWVGTGTAVPFLKEWKENHPQPAIVVGTRYGKVYGLDKDGRTITRDGMFLPYLDTGSYEDTGWATDKQAEEQAYWLQAASVIRQVVVDPENFLIIIGSEDRFAYALDYRTGEMRWQFETEGWVRAVCVCDINGDGKNEILLGSTDKYLYVLDSEGDLLAKRDMGLPIHNIVAADIDLDRSIEILVGTDGKGLTALTCLVDGTFIKKWHCPLPHRILSLCVANFYGDERLEIVAGLEDKHLYFLDAQGNIIWRHQQNYRVYSLFPYDIDHDGIPELLVGSDDNAIRAMRVRLRAGVDRRIRRLYSQLNLSDPANIEDEFTPDEYNLLLDIIKESQVEHVTLNQAEERMKAGDYLGALKVLLKLEHQRAQPRWPRRKKIGHIRSIAFRHIIGKTRREIIVGTSDGEVTAFNPDGKRQWSTRLNERIVDVQTGFVEHNQKEEIVICSSDHLVLILKGIKTEEDLRTAHIEARLSSVCIAAPRNLQSTAEIIIGSEESKLYIYGSDLKEPLATIHTEKGIRVVRTQPSQKEHQPEIVAGCLDNQVYAYTRYGEPLWKYPTHDHIRSLCLKDINGDGNIEIIVGSEDRNLHVLDSTGHLLWRYFLPHSVLSVDAADADLDGEVEIFAGCGDGFLYVFNREGEFQWKYQAYDRIHAVRVEDIDDDGFVEIALGSEDELELLQVLNLSNIHTLINRCWSMLTRQQPPEGLLKDMLRDPDSLLQSFALKTFASQDSFSAKDFTVLEQYITDGDIEVRLALVQVVLEHYQVAPERAQKILQSLSTDQEQEVRSQFLKYLPSLMKYDWDNGLLYMKRFQESENRYVRRLVVRTLDHVIETQVEILNEGQHTIFDMLLDAALDKRSEWVRREAARTLAHFLDRYNGRLIVNVQLFIVKEVKHEILWHIAHCASVPIVKNYLTAVIPMLRGLNDENMLQRVQQVVTALEAAAGIVYRRDLRAIYVELCRLLSITTIVDIAQYQCPLNMSQFQHDNEYARNILDVFKELGSISRALRTYLRREGLPDRLAGLLDAITAIDNMTKSIEKPYSRKITGEPMSKLPDHEVFILLLTRWRKMVQTKLNELRGRAEFTAELPIKQARLEDRVGVWLRARNTGRSSASNVKITLLHNDDFPVVGRQAVDYELVSPDDQVNAEFTVEPKVSTLDLRFAITYDDAEQSEKEETFIDRLELNESHQEFCFIPNPYSTGAPTHDSKMFFGREADMTYLRDNLTREAKTVIILYGQRRSGKTTLLFQLIGSGKLGEHVPVLIDMQGLALNINIRNFLYKVAYAIAQGMKKYDLQVCDPSHSDFDTEPTHAFDTFLNTAEKYLEGRRLILMIDEFEVLEDQVVKGKLAYEIFPYLRNMLQHRQNINFLFAGTHKITEHTKWYRSIFFNIARHYRLARLNKAGAEALIQEPVKGFLEYEPMTIEKIHLLTDDQPYLIHLLCRAIVDYCNDWRKTYVTIHDVNLVLQEVMQTIHFHFDWLWDQISPEERMALSALAAGGREDGRWLTLDEVIELYQRASIPFKREYLLNSLRSLIDADIIESENSDIRDIEVDSSRFRIPVGLTRRWLLRDKPLELTRNEEMGG